jgi:hypothetical protein
LNEEHDKGFDKAVYTKNRCMKCINQSKGDGRIQSIIYNDNPCDHFITCFIDKESNQLPDFQNIVVLKQMKNSTWKSGKLRI